jgi:hypothetical protein
MSSSEDDIPLLNGSKANGYLARGESLPGRYLLGWLQPAVSPQYVVLAFARHISFLSSTLCYWLRLATPLGVFALFTNQLSLLLL